MRAVDIFRSSSISTVSPLGSTSVMKSTLSGIFAPSAKSMTTALRERCITPTPAGHEATYRNEVFPALLYLSRGELTALYKYSRVVGEEGGGRPPKTLGLEPGKLDRGSPPSRAVSALLSDLRAPHASPQVVASLLDQLARPLGSDAARQELVVCLSDETVPPMARCGLLELLAEAGQPNLLGPVLGALRSGIDDEFLLGCTNMLRLLLPAQRRTEILDLLRAQGRRLATKTLDARSGGDVDKRIFRSTLLALGTFGETRKDLGLLIRVLSNDLEYEYSNQALAATRNLIASCPHGVADDDAERLRILCNELLTAWAQPRTIRNFEMFARSSQTLRVLCARLHEDDLFTALQAVRQSRLGALARRFRQHLEATERDLRVRGFESWVQSRLDATAKSKEDVEALLANLQDE